MTKLINDLYYMVEYQIGQLDTQTETEKELTERREALQDKIALRLGEDGQDMMEALNALNLELETIHDQALFRAAMPLGTEIARPVVSVGRAHNVRPYSTSR